MYEWNPLCAADHLGFFVADFPLQPFQGGRVLLGPARQLFPSASLNLETHFTFSHFIFDSTWKLGQLEISWHFTPALQIHVCLQIESKIIFQCRNSCIGCLALLTVFLVRVEERPCWMASCRCCRYWLECFLTLISSLTL